MSGDLGDGPPGAPLEIERTWLLRAMPALPRESIEEVLTIRQGYFPEQEGAASRPDAPEGRLRSIGRIDGSVEYRHTIKRGEGLVRTEIEREIDQVEFDEGWALTEGRRLAKTRYRVRSGDLLWEVDRFDGVDLVLAEVELPTAETPVTPPRWLAPVIVREVTDEPAFRNARIALRVHRAAMPSDPPGTAESTG